MNSARTTKPASPWHKDKREQERENKRDAVLRTAARLFAERGYHATSLDAVADELHITRPTLYYYLKSKDEILFECVRIGLQLIEEAASEVTSRGGSATEQLIAVMRKYAEIITMEFGMCLVRVGEDPLPQSSRLKLRKLKASIDLKIRTLIAQGVEEGVFAPCNPKLAAFAAAGALNSIARWYRPDGPLGPDEVIDMFVDTLMNGLLARPANSRAKAKKVPARRTA